MRMSKENEMKDIPEAITDEGKNGTVIAKEGMSAPEQLPCQRKNIIKTRDDVSPVCFTVEDGECKVGDGVKCSWADNDFPFDRLRERIEPWLTSLFQSEHLNLLVGSGLTKGVCHLAHVIGAGMTSPQFENHGDAIERAAQKSASLAGRKDGNFEDRMRVAFDLLRTLELFDRDDAQKLRVEIESKLEGFVDDVLKSEAGLLSSDNKVEALNCLILFLMSFASRTGNRDRLHIFTLASHKAA